MLIVVAIIAILIAVSIPLISSALEKARHAVDDANRRDAIALGTVKYLTEDADDLFNTDSSKQPDGATVAGSDTTLHVTYYYVVSDNSQGELKGTTGGNNNAKGQCTKLTDCDEKYSKNAGEALTVDIYTDGTVKTSWDVED